MSDPVPGPTPNVSNPDENPGVKRQPWWLFLSIGLHVAAISALLLLTPVREVLFESDAAEPKAAEVTMASDTLAEVAQKLEQINSEAMERNVRDLQALTQMMQDKQQAQREQFEVFAADQVERAPDDAKRSLEEAAQAMAQAIKHIEAGELSEADVQQTLAQSSQEEAMQRLEMLEAPPEAVAPLREAMTAHQKARSEQQEHKAATSKHRAAERDLERSVDRDLKKQQERLQTLQSEKKKQEDRLTEQEQQLNQQQKELEQVKTTVEAAAETADRGEKRELDQQVKAAERQLSTVERDIKTTQRRLDDAAKKVAEQEQDVRETQAQIDKEQQAVESTAKEQAAERQQTAAAQKQAMQQQEAANQKLADAAAELATKLAEQSPPVEAANAEAMPIPEDASILELYALAQQAEQQLTEQYRQTRAMTLATIRDIPFEQALQQIDKVQPVRPQLDAAALEADVRTTEQLAAQKQEVTTALNEAGAMVSLGNLLLQQADQEILNQTGKGTGMSLAQIQAKSAAMQELEALAQQQQEGQSVDVAAAMMAALGEGEQEPLEGEVGQSDVPRRTDVPPQIPLDVKPAFGRKVGTVGEPAEWMAVVSWYLIGPFPNPGRTNLSRTFPPESLVDLDATYPGKRGEPIRWHFVNSGDELGAIVPPNDEDYGIWYAYTELKFERPRDLWIAMGSDDKGRVWINDVPVWTSIDKEKALKPGEAIYRVHFKEGRNKILFRLENGWRASEFSFWVHLPESDVGRGPS